MKKPSIVAIISASIVLLIIITGIILGQIGILDSWDALIFVLIVIPVSIVILIFPPTITWLVMRRKTQRETAVANDSFTSQKNKDQ